MAVNPDEVELAELLRKLQELYPLIWAELYEILKMLQDPRYGLEQLLKLVALIAGALQRYPNAARVLVRRIIILIFRLRGLANPFSEIAVKTFAEKVIEAWPVAVAVVIGLILGALAGTCIDGRLGRSAGLYNVGKADPKCVNTNGLKPHLPIFESYWGCSRSLAKTLDSAQAACTTGHACGGSCSAGTESCVAVDVVEKIDQTPGWFSCDTLVAFHCECACR
jgi:hypothetical protein